MSSESLAMDDHKRGRTDSVAARGSADRFGYEWDLYREMRPEYEEQFRRWTTHLRPEDWRGKTLAAIRKCFLEADREIIEEWKWMGSPVWSRDGMIAVGNAHKEKVKITFVHGAKLPDPEKLFNAGLGGNAWRAIDFFEGDRIDAPALKNLIRAAVDYNQGKSKKKAPARARAKARKSRKR